MPKESKLSGQEKVLSFELIGILNPNELTQSQDFEAGFTGQTNLPFKRRKSEKRAAFFFQVSNNDLWFVKHLGFRHQST